MRLCVIKNLLGSAVAYEFVNHLALAVVLCARVQLSVRKRARAALPELYV